jgi:hypothetical protein
MEGGDVRGAGVAEARARTLAAPDDDGGDAAGLATAPPVPTDRSALPPAGTSRVEIVLPPDASATRGPTSAAASSDNASAGTGGAGVATTERAASVRLGSCGTCGAGGLAGAGAEATAGSAGGGGATASAIALDDGGILGSTRPGASGLGGSSRTVYSRTSRPLAHVACRIRSTKGSRAARSLLTWSTERPSVLRVRTTCVPRSNSE